MPRVRITALPLLCRARAWPPEGGGKNPARLRDRATRWHRHTTLEWRVAVDPETGYVMDLGTLKDLVNRRVVDELDHSNLNLDVPWLEGMIPSTENLAVAIWERIAPHIPTPAKLDKVVLWETPRQWAEYRGE